MGQMGFFDLGNRYSGLDAKNEPLLRSTGWFRGKTCARVLRRCGGVRTRRVNRGRDASRGMRL